MRSNEILKADILDIIFDNRNKQYGAYALRKHYNERLSIALALALSIILFFVFFIRSLKGSEIKMDSDPVYTVTTVVNPTIKEKKIEPLKKQESQKPVAQKQYEVFKIVDHAVKPVATIDDLQKVLVSNANSDGPDVISSIPSQPGLVGNGSGEVKPAEVPKENVVLVQRAPQFPGGNEAWMNFLNRNLRAPIDLEAGEKKIVMIKFDVAEDGSITNFKVIQSAGNAFDNEVIRVLKKMPKWLPAIQNGKPASVSFSQPVTFMGVEE